MMCERYLFAMELIPGTEEDYERRHRELWPDMREALLRSGFTNYTLFRHNLSVIGYTECAPDARTVFAAMANEPVTERWNTSFEGILSMDDKGSFAVPYVPIWHLDETRMETRMEEQQ